MAFDHDTIMTVHSSSMMQEDDEDDEMEDQGQHHHHHHHHHHHRYNMMMSRLSICTSNSKGSISDDANNDDDDVMLFNMSRLSVEDGSEADADGELSDAKEAVSVELLEDDDDDSDRETTGWLSLPASHLHRRAVRLRRPGSSTEEGRRKAYDSENESCRGSTMCSTRRKRRMMMYLMRERRLERSAWEMRKGKAMLDLQDDDDHHQNYPSDQEITEYCHDHVVRAKPEGGGSRGGGRRSRVLCMDLDEIKACRDLGFDLQREWTQEIPVPIPNRNISAAAGSATCIDTDSGGNSPIACWKISSPGDDPRDVKARLKVWAQAVALASASRPSYSL